MKKRVLLIMVLLLFCVVTYVRAAYFENLPYVIKQPDGKTINCFVSGDEYYNWIHDYNGYTIIQSPDGYFYYAEQDGDLVRPSKYLVGSVDPASVGLSKWIKISKSRYEERKVEALSFQTSADGPGYAPRTGTLNNIVIYIRFSDDAEITTTRQEYDDKFNPSTGVSLKSYFTEVSYNKLTISSTHYPVCSLTTNLSYQDSHLRSYFQPYNATTNPTGYTDATDRRNREHQLLVDAVNWININSPVPATLNLDGDGDGKVDNVCFIIKGSSGGWNELLWAHRWTLESQTVNINGKRVYDYTFQPENQVSVKILCHEMFHALGAPDLYHYSNQGVLTPVRNWDIMESGSGHMLTYMKWKYTGNNWITAIPEITTSGTYTLNPVTSSTNICYKIASPNSTNEYFMLEYRNQSGTFESNLPGSGLIVYRIDTREVGNENGPPDEVYIYRPGGTLTNNGTPDEAFFSSTINRTAINDMTNPTSFLQDGGEGGLYIENIKKNGQIIEFDVKMPGIQNITSNNLYVNKNGIVSVQFLAPQNADYYVGIWDNNGIWTPNWNFTPDYTPLSPNIGSYPVFYNSGQLHTIEFEVIPNSEQGTFQFWLYKKNGLGIYEVIDTKTATLDAVVDVTPPQVTQKTYTTSLSTNIVIAFNESIDESTLNPTNINVQGSNTGIHSFSKTYDINTRILTIDPTVDFSLNENVTITLTAGIKDLAGNGLDGDGNGTSGPNYVFSYNTLSKPYILLGSVNPVSGTTTDIYVFSITYIDPNTNPNPPSDVRVVIDGTIYQMQKKNISDNNYQTGVEYIYSFSTTTTGTHYFSFGASDYSGNVLVPYPSSGTLSFNVRQSAAGWDAGIDPLNTTYSPASIKANTTVTIVTGVKNNGIYAYSQIPVRIEMRDQQGTLLGSRNLTVFNLAPGAGTTISTTLTVPGTATYGKYALSSCVLPTLDNSPVNDCYSNYFFIGENLGNEQFRNTVGQQTLEKTSPSNVISINGQNFTLLGINTSTGYATMRDPGGTIDKVYVNQIKVYGSYNSLIQNDAVWTSGTLGYASLHGYYAYNTGAAFDNVEINANPGTTVYAYANAPGGTTFLSNGNYSLYSTSTTSIQSWFSSVSRVNTWARIKIKFDIPANAPIGKTTLYFLTEYASPSTAMDMTRLTFYITNPVPIISSINKAVISADDQIVITGTNFGTPGSVKFNDISSSNIQQWTATSITCIVPQGVTAGSVTVSNSDGTSNGYSYTVLSSTGIPQVLTNIPDQQLNLLELKTIVDLDNIISDPNGTEMTFSVVTNNTKITVDASTFETDHILKLIGASDLLHGSKIDITGTDASGKSANTSFNITVPGILKPSTNYISVPVAGGSGSIVISSNISWSVSEDIDFITFTIIDNIISLTILPNNQSSPRTGIISITGGDIHADVIIYQEPGISIPTAPTIGTIVQPTCNLATGSVVLSGLPATGTWTLTRTPGEVTTTGTGTSTTIMELAAGTYTFKVTNSSGGTSEASPNVVILPQPTTPNVSTSVVSEVLSSTATCGGIVISIGCSEILQRGVIWSTSPNPTVDLSTKTSDGTGIGAFTSSITGLTAGTTYHVRAYATNSVGTDYGNDVTFTTNPIVIPTLTTTAVTSISLKTAVSGGNITADGGGAITARGVCWATTVNPTINNFRTNDGLGTGSYVSNLNGLMPGTLYYVRAYATNNTGTAYGNQITFTTIPVIVATLSTTSVTSITQTTAVSGGNILNDGGGAITVSGVCWATIVNPTISNSKTLDGTGVGSFVSNLTGLLPGTTYHIRSYATNSAGTAYGNDISFNTTTGTHFVPAWSGSGMDHMNLYALTAKLDNIDLQPGDEIGIFDGNVCVGMGTLAQVLTGSTYLSMVVSKDDPDTPSKDGYTPGNTISFKVWDSGAGKEFSDAQAAYVSGSGIFSVGGTALFNLNAVTSITQDISLTAGWNIMSFAGEPDNMSLSSIVNSLKVAGTLVKIQDEKGSAIEQLPSPIGWVDNIGLMKVSEGYKIKVSSNTDSESNRKTSYPALYH